MLQLVDSLALHKDKVWDIDESNGLLATGSTDRCIKIVDLRKSSNKVIDELDDSVHKKTIRSVAWRPSSCLLAAGSFDSTISIWGKDDSPDDYTSTVVGFEMELLAIIEGHENEVKGVAWSHDGTYLASCSRDKSVWIWETDEMGEEYECISVLQEHSQDVKHVIWHSSLHLLASSSYDDTVRIWKEFDDDWEAAAVLSGHEGTVWCSDFEKSELSIRLCSGSDDRTVRIWKYTGDNEDDEQEWICEAILPHVHSRAIYSVAWGPKSLIASAGSDGILAVYEQVDGTWKVVAKMKQAHGTHEVNVVKWISMEGLSMLATGGDDGRVNLWKFINP